MYECDYVETCTIAVDTSVISAKMLDMRIEYLQSVCFSPKDIHEIDLLLDLREQCLNYRDWYEGDGVIIRADCFAEYVQDYLIDIGELPEDLPSYVVIDWQATANKLSLDYDPIDFDGTTYLIYKH
jgi:hypothetical protein